MNNNLLSYKGFYGSVNFSAADEVFYGKVEGVHDLVSFEGATVKELKQDFQKAVEDYILFCKFDGLIQYSNQTGYSSAGSDCCSSKKYIVEPFSAAGH